MGASALRSVLDWRACAPLAVVIFVALWQYFRHFRGRHDIRDVEKVVYFVRHGQALHNVLMDWSLPDPDLTPLGERQAGQLDQDPLLQETLKGSVQLIVVSPLRRTLRTALLGFGHLEDKLKFKWLIDPDIQEKGDVECNRAAAEKGASLLDSFAHEELQNQYGKLSFSHQDVRPNFERFTAMLRKRRETHIIVVTHDHVLAHGLGLWREGRFGNGEVRPYALTREGTWQRLDLPDIQSLQSAAQQQARPAVQQFTHEQLFSQHLAQRPTRARDRVAMKHGTPVGTPDPVRKKLDVNYAVIKRQCQPEPPPEETTCPSMAEMLAELDEEIAADNGDTQKEN